MFIDSSLHVHRRFLQFRRWAIAILLQFSTCLCISLQFQHISLHSWPCKVVFLASGLTTRGMISHFITWHYTADVRLSFLWPLARPCKGYLSLCVLFYDKADHVRRRLFCGLWPDHDTPVFTFHYNVDHVRLPFVASGQAMNGIISQFIIFQHVSLSFYLFDILLCVQEVVTNFIY